MSSESTTFIIDGSRRMVNNGHFAKVIAYLEYVLLDKCKRNRKTDWISCYLSNSKLTKNSQEIPNVCEIQQFLAPVTVEDSIRTLKELQCYSTERIEQGETDEDEQNTMIQSILVAALDIKAYFKNRKILKQLVIFTDDVDTLDISDEEIDIYRDETKVRFIFIDCRDDPNASLKGTSWDRLLKSIPSSIELHMNDLLIEITSPRPNIIKPVRVFSGQLRLGADILTDKEPSADEETFSLSIKVEGFPATKPVSSLNRKSVLKLIDTMNPQSEYTQLKTVTEYEVQERADDNQLEESQEQKKPTKPAMVAKESISKAYRYGSTYVILPSTIYDLTLYESFPGLDIRGFLDRKALRRYYLTSESRFIIADTKSGTIADSMSLSALVDVMLENDKLAIARFVAKRNSEVEMVMLCPILVRHRPTEDSGEKFARAFISNRLPFAEDERVSDFPRLVKRKTTSWQPMNNKNDDDDEQILDALMQDFVQAMDMDNLPQIPANEYYQPITEVNTQTVLPLPSHAFEPFNANSNYKDEDPLCIPAINLHRQKQVILEWIHQRLINKVEDFDVPPLPDILQSKIAPYYTNDTKPDIAQLINLLKLKPAIKSEHNKAYVDELIPEPDVGVPPLNVLLERGKR